MTSSSQNDSELVDEVLLARETGEMVLTELRTDKRVLARVTDGIYREPSSAIRELVANAYDADATLVKVTTNPPTFDQITVRDNGIGMSVAALVHVIRHIGGSAKRTKKGADLGITGLTANLTPGGRRLIGKIGIGLFSVSQLTRHFRITTKRQGDAYRLVAEVKLHTFNEETIAQEEEDSVTSGAVRISSTPADDPETHGTEVTLLRLTKAAQSLLRSEATWSKVLGSTDESSEYFGETVTSPAYHVGSPDFQIPAQLPWSPTEHTDPLQRFGALVDSVVEQACRVRHRPNLETTFDYYLRMAWNISLAVPLPYVDGENPFLVPSSGPVRCFTLQNRKRGQAQPISGDLTPAEALGLGPERFAPPNFRVQLDDLELKRPISLNRMVRLAPRDRKLVACFGSYNPSLDSISKRESGGSHFSIDGYLLWTPSLVPSDHSGVLVRIAGASGTLFDSSFLGYGIQETTRLAQISGEIFVREGLESALNIDRESFNFGHPHTKLLTLWTHRALRQVTNVQKRLESERRAFKNDAELDRQRSAVKTFVDDVLTRRGVEPVEVKLTAPEGPLFEEGNTLALRGSRVLEIVSRDMEARKATQKQKNKLTLWEEKAQELTRLLIAYGLAEHLSYKELEQLVRDIVSLFWVGES